MLLKDIELYFRLRYRGRSTMPERLEILQEHRKYVLNQQTKWAEYLQNLDDSERKRREDGIRGKDSDM